MSAKPQKQPVAKFETPLKSHFIKKIEKKWGKLEINMLTLGIYLTHVYP